jgi:hypothetical protein
MTCDDGGHTYQCCRDTYVFDLPYHILEKIASEQEIPDSTLAWENGERGHLQTIVKFYETEPLLCERICQICRYILLLFLSTTRPPPATMKKLGRKPGDDDKSGDGDDIKIIDDLEPSHRRGYGVQKEVHSFQSPLLVFQVMEDSDGKCTFANNFYFPQFLQTKSTSYRLVARIVSVGWSGGHFTTLTHHALPAAGTYYYNDMLNAKNSIVYAKRVEDGEKGFVGRNEKGSQAVYAKCNEV